MVLAQRVERDPLDDHHLAVADVEDGAVYEPIRVHVVAAGKLEPHPMHSLRSAQQALTLRILADFHEDVTDGMLDALGPARPRTGRRLLGGLHALVVFPALDLLDHLADMRLEVELVAFERLVGRHRWLLRANPTPCCPTGRRSRVGGSPGP